MGGNLFKNRRALKNNHGDHCMLVGTLFLFLFGMLTCVNIFIHYTSIVLASVGVGVGGGRGAPA